jgi:hypothetical protein
MRSEVLTAVKMMMAFYWVLRRVVLYVDTNVSEKQA